MPDPARLLAYALLRASPLLEIGLDWQRPRLRRPRRQTLVTLAGDVTALALLVLFTFGLALYAR
jgi:hypothetical protein